MSLRERLGNWIAGTKRASPRPIDFEGNQALFYGPGIGNQPEHDRLLAETLGVTETATKAIVNRVASLRPRVKRSMRDEAGTIVDEIIDDHPLAMLLDRPHPNLSWRMFLRLTAQWILITGEAYWQKVGGSGPLDGITQRLYPASPLNVRPRVVMNEIAGYEVTDGDGRVSTHPPDDFVRFFFPDPENPWGSEGYLGPIGIIADSHKFASQHMRSHYQHDANPKLALEAQENAVAFTPEQESRFHEKYRNLFQMRGGTAHGAPFITPTHYKLIQLMMQSGADITPLMEYWDRTILRHYGVPRSVLGEVMSGDRSSAETMLWTFDLHTILPLADMIADTLTLQLASDYEDEVFVEFEPFVASDKDYDIRKEEHDLTHGLKTINQVLEARGDDTQPWGDDPLMSNKLGIYTGEPPQAPPDMGSDDGEDEEVDVDRLEREAHIRIRRAARKARRRRAA